MSAIVPSWEDVANRWERAYNEVCEERDALKIEVDQLNDECQREADARGALERRLMQLGVTP